MLICEYSVFTVCYQSRKCPYLFILTLWLLILRGASLKSKSNSGHLQVSHTVAHYSWTLSWIRADKVDKVIITEGHKLLTLFLPLIDRGRSRSNDCHSEVIISHGQGSKHSI